MLYEDTVKKAERNARYRKTKGFKQSVLRAKLDGRRAASAKRYYEKNKEAIRIKRIVREKALSAYPNPQQCSIKGCAQLGERHHPDYAIPLDIIWLCRKHHVVLHKQKY